MSYPSTQASSTPTLKLWKHQEDGINLAKQRDDFGFFFEVGTGKTATAINTLREWCLKDNKILSTLIICPPIVIRQWGEEIAKFSKLGGYVTLLTGDGKRRAKLLKESPGKIFITNFETLNMSDCFSAMLAKKFDVLIVDESHKVKDMKAKRTKQTVLLAENIRRKLIMTGTPVLNSPMDLFSQFLVLDGGKTFGKNFFVFRARYFYDKNANMPKHNYFPDWRIRPKAEEEITKLISQKTLRVKKDECLDLPPLVKVTVPVELSREQRKAYDEMKEDLVTYLGDKVCVANMALTKILRMQQIVSGFISLSAELEGTEQHIKGFSEVPRVTALSDILEDIVPYHKVIVWACFKHNYMAIRGVCERLGVKYVEITGERTETQKRDAVESFRTDDGVRVCIANQKAGGVGLNLIEASYSVYYSRSYSLEDDIQSEARNYRGGSERHDKVTRIDIVATGTVDELILDALKKKQNLAEKILDLKKELTLC